VLEHLDQAEFIDILCAGAFGPSGIHRYLTILTDRWQSERVPLKGNSPWLFFEQKRDM
jgi:hypothetical protein